MKLGQKVLAAYAGLAPVITVALVGMAIAGSGRGLGDVADTTLVQARTEDAVRSRVFAAQDRAAESVTDRRRGSV